MLDDLEAVQAEVIEWLRQCRTAALPMGDVHHGRTPIFDTRYDDAFTALPGFALALAQLEAISGIKRLYGDGFQSRLLLGLAFEMIPRMVIQDPGGALDALIAEAWRAFVRELVDPEWHYSAVANLGGIVPVSGFDESIEITAGVKVITRTRAFVESLGAVAGPLRQDWSEGDHSELVIVADGAAPKSPENVVNMSDSAILERLTRSVTAIRLARFGGLRHGVVFCLRKSRFMRLGGVLHIGAGSGRAMGAPELLWDDGARSAAASMYSALVEIGPRLAVDWGSVAVAIRSYQSALNRTGVEAADRILDATTAIEALVGDRTETVFKVRLRIASLLGDSDNDVRELFALVGQYYDLRSTLVHGDTVKPKHQQLMLNSACWIEIARLAICAFLKLAEARVFESGKKVREEIDALLVHGGERARLRGAFQERWSAATAPRSGTGSRGRIIGFWAEVPSAAVVVTGGDPS